MDRKYNKNLMPLSKALRKNMTKEEKHLWYDFLRGYHTKFLRQKVLGQYIVDFYCAKAKLVLELDGSEHYTQEGKIKDGKVFVANGDHCPHFDLHRLGCAGPEKEDHHHRAKHGHAAVRAEILHPLCAV